MTDPIADMIIRIKNGFAAGKTTVLVPYSKMKAALAEILQTHNYVETVQVVEAKPQKQLELTLKYVGKSPAVSGVKRLSKPGRRLYSSSTKITRTLGGYGLTIVSTSKGLMSDTDARKQNIGGELVCQIW